MCVRAPTGKETETLSEDPRDEARVPGTMRRDVDLLHGRAACLSATQEPASPPGKVLLIDDSALTLDTVSAFLGDMGWTVLTAQRGSDAVVMGSTPDLDVVIADLNMPDMNGIEVFRRLFAIDPLLPVIILSEEAWRRRRSSSRLACSATRRSRPSLVRTRSPAKRWFSHRMRRWATARRTAAGSMRS